VTEPCVLLVVLFEVFRFGLDLLHSRLDLGGVAAGEEHASAETQNETEYE